jgi:hypothetical protein
MAENDFPKIVSFVIRFVQEQPAQAPGGIAYRGTIRHIQSDQEMAFTCWDDAMVFMQKYVPIGDISEYRPPQIDEKI